MKLFILLFLLLFTTVSATGRLVVMTEEFPPFGYYEDDSLVGFGVDLVREILKKQDLPDSIMVYPWARAYNDIQNRENRVLFLMARTDERDSLFQWVGPLFEDTVFLYQHEKSTDTIRSLEDAREVKSILVNRGFPQHTYLQKKGFTNLYLTVNPQQDLRMISAGHGDVCIIGQAALSELLKQREFASVQIRKTDVHLFVSQLYVAFSKDVDPKIVQQWNERVVQLREEGVVKELRKRYFNTSN